MNSQRRSPWPYAIIVWFVVFIAFLAAFIVYAVRQREDLVRHDYYDAEVRYQQQVESANRGQAVSRDVAITYQATEQRVKIQLPPAQASLHPVGRINFYRPSDASLDHTTPLVTDADGVQHIQATHLRPGLWKIRLYWTVNEQEFYFDQAIVIHAKQSASSVQGSKFLVLDWMLEVGCSRFDVSQSLPEKSVQGSTGNLPVPSGYQPDGTGKATIVNVLRLFRGVAFTRSGRQVADRGGQVARTTLFQTGSQV